MCLILKRISRERGLNKLASFLRRAGKSARTSSFGDQATPNGAMVSHDSLSERDATTEGLSRRISLIRKQKNIGIR